MYKHNIHVYELMMHPTWHCSLSDSTCNHIISSPCSLASGHEDSLLVLTVVGSLASITATFKLAAL